MPASRPAGRRPAGRRPAARRRAPRQGRRQGQAAGGKRQRQWLGFRDCFFSGPKMDMAVSHLLLHQNRTKNIPQQKHIKNISKYIQDVSKMSKINTKYQAAAGPARPGPSPGPRTDSKQVQLQIIVNSFQMIEICLTIIFYMFLGQTNQLIAWPHIHILMTSAYISSAEQT